MWKPSFQNSHGQSFEKNGKTCISRQIFHKTSKSEYLLFHHMWEDALSFIEYKWFVVTLKLTLKKSIVVKWALGKLPWVLELIILTLFLKFLLESVFKFYKFSKQKVWYH